MTVNLEPIKARLAAATPGPWKVDEYISCVETTHPDYQEVSESYVGYHADICNVWDGEYIENPNRKGDAEFIANAPTDIAALVEEVERYQKLYNQVNTANDLNRKDADNYKSLINKIKAVCDQSNNSDGAYIKRLIEEMEGE